MDREEARNLLAKKLCEYRQLSYAELVSKMGNDEYFEIQGPTNTEYQIEVQFLWDDNESGNLRVLAGIDDGSLRGAFRPVCEDFIMSPDGHFIGE